MRAALVALAFLFPAQALAAEVCVVARPAPDDDGFFTFSLWLEKGPTADLTYAWHCESVSDSGSASSSNSSFASPKPDAEEKLGACSVSAGTEPKVDITVDLTVNPAQGADAEPRKLDAIKFSFPALGDAKPQRACRKL